MKTIQKQIIKDQLSQILRGNFVVLKCILFFENERLKDSQNIQLRNNNKNKANKYKIRKQKRKLLMYIHVQPFERKLLCFGGSSSWEYIKMDIVKHLFKQSIRTISGVFCTKYCQIKWYNARKRFYAVPGTREVLFTCYYYD